MTMHTNISSLATPRTGLVSAGAVLATLAAFALIPITASAATFNVVPDSTGFRAVIVKGADHLLFQQNSDGGWAWTSAGGSSVNTFGVTALGLLDAYKLTHNQTYLDGAKKTGDNLKAIATDESGHKFYSQDIEFLAELGSVTSDSSYTQKAGDVMNHFLTESNRYCASGCSDPTVIFDYYNGGGPDDWQLGSWINAAKLTGHTDWATSLATMQAGRVLDPSIYNSADDVTAGKYYALGITGSLRSAALLSADNANNVYSKLKAEQNTDGSIKADPSDGVIQATAYAALGFLASSHSADAEAAAGYLAGAQLGNGGWTETDSTEYTEVNSEVIQAIFSTLPSNTFYAIQDAVNAASSGATIQVAAGTYNENQIVIDKALNVQGAGIDQSIIDGGDAALSTAGLVRITANGDVTFNGFSIKNAGGPAIVGNKDDLGDGNDGHDNKVNVGIVSSGPLGATYTISNNKIFGTNSADDQEDYGFYANAENSGQESVVFTHNQITQTGANPILIEKHSGPTEVSYNSLDEGSYGTVVYFNMTYGGVDVTTAQKVNNNNINLGSGNHADSDYYGGGIVFRSSFVGGTDDGKYSDIQITNNVITNVKGYRRGISLSNDAAGDGLAGEISSPVITGNTITANSGTTENIGIQLRGLVNGANIQNNTFSNFAKGFYSAKGTASDSTAYPTNTLFGNSQMNGNAIDLQWDGAFSFDATKNYWGSTTGPVVGTDIQGAGKADVSFSPWYTDAGMTTLRYTTTTSGSEASTTVSTATASSTTTGAGTVEVNIPEGTVVTGPAAWDGTITLPTATTTTVAPVADSGNNASIVGSIEVGFGDTLLTFSKAVQLVFAGQAGNSIGYSHGAGTFHQITAACVDNTQSTNDLLGDGADCKINASGDLVVWTKHFSTFTTYTQSAIPPSGGGGGGGGGGGISDNYSVSINNGATDVNSTSVTLSISPAATANQMQVSNTPDFSASTWVTFQSTYPWTLTAGYGTKTVYVRYGSNGSVVANAQDSITLTATSLPVVSTPTTQPQGQVLGASVYHFANDFGIGSNGQDVTELQKILIAGGFLNVPAPIDHFGPLTQAAVKKYQRAHSITPLSGYAGPKTRAVLNQGTTPTLSDEQRATFIAQLQAQLQVLLDKIRAIQAGQTQ